MKLTNYLSSIFLILNYCCLVCSAQWEKINEATADIRNIIGTALEPLEGEFHKLSPKGRYATGVVVGYTSAKFAYRTTVKIAKCTGAAFIVAEVANRVGLLDDIQLSEEKSQSLQIVRKKVTETMNCCRLEVRKRFSIDNMKSLFDRTMEKDTMCSLGFATGAVAGLVW